MNKKILIFAMASDKKEAIRLIGADLGITVVEVLPREYNQQVGYLAGMPGVKRAVGKYKGQAFEKEMMVLYGMDSGSIDDFLKESKEAGLRVDLKAAVTPTNAFWTAEALYRELAAEHQQMQSYKE